jgi:hypothetical protein
MYIIRLPTPNPKTKRQRHNCEYIPKDPELSCTVADNIAPAIINIPVIKKMFFLPIISARDPKIICPKKVPIKAIDLMSAFMFLVSGW